MLVCAYAVHVQRDSCSATQSAEGNSCWRFKLLVNCIIYLLMWLLWVDFRPRVTQGVPPLQARLHHRLDFAASTVLLLHMAPVFRPTPAPPLHTPELQKNKIFPAHQGFSRVGSSKSQQTAGLGSRWNR